MEKILNPPDADRTIHGLRDTGYDFHTAAADIVDNSIAAGATKISVQIVVTREGRKFVFFGDNGAGMNNEDLLDAMRYGAPRRKNLKSLGKFGLGLKTASTSVCLKLSVLSKKNSADSLAKLVWDLDHVADVNDWEMLAEAVSDEEKEKFDELCGDKGTLVVWSKCDRMLQSEFEAGSANERRAVKRLADRLDDHFALTYYRFLDPNDKRAKTISIEVNGKSVEPWNPFFLEKSEQMLSENQQVRQLRFEDGNTYPITIRSYILPIREDLSEAEKAKAKISNNRQGFYIHRENRVIQSGGWLGVFGNTLEPHRSLHRVEFDFDYRVDEAFKVDVKKSKIVLDPGLVDGLQNLLAPFHREAEDRYRRKNKKINLDEKIDHKSANLNIAEKKTTTATIIDVNLATQTSTVDNNRGGSIILHQPVEENVSPESLYVEAVDDIKTGFLWEPAIRKSSSKEGGYKQGVKLNKHHDFYQKIYQRAKSNGFAVEGMDLLFWTLAVAETNGTNDEIKDIFEDLREEVSRNLNRLLREVPELTEDDFVGQDD